ncbi:hypothetical protein Poli38472_002178 [Pythium oligandrum]|uniref:Pectate lyase n=1 Tax=Pythium oligandrum TaxID=41045 RepID=A0A8K1CJA9_PYTOL|nr:hypothetical protein Poli38472_002178 [Pythium oligandrum]|eukprot:TMW63237.1 hypothetical protein Poli38472_002178 [Pythium oligandrum]
MEVSSSCDGKVVSGIKYDNAGKKGGLVVGSNKTRISMYNNVILAMSGRSPKFGGSTDANVVAHVANNYFWDNTGHSFDVASGAAVVVEGNYFKANTKPITSPIEGSVIMSTASNVNSCSSTLGRACVANTIESNGALASKDSDALTKAKTIATTYKPSVAKKLAYSTTNWGVGDL